MKENLGGRVTLNNSKRAIKLEAVVLTVLMLGSVFFMPVGSVGVKENQKMVNPVDIWEVYNENKNIVQEAYKLDRKYVFDESQPVTLDGDNKDAGTKSDAGDKISRSTPIYPGEPIDDTPGRGRTGKISSSTDEDWYMFSACEGQKVQISVTPIDDIDVDLYLENRDGDVVASSTNSGSATESLSYTLDSTGYWFMQIKPVSGKGEYSFSIDVTGENDAGTGGDAGDSFSSATQITPGSYYGYLDKDDEEDWYKFNVNQGQGIHFILEVKNYALYSDFDISLYDPSGNFVYTENYYYDDELLYPATESGTWAVKISIFPGYNNAPQPDEWKYYYYGSGAYHLQFSIDSSAPEPPAPIPEPQITPVAKTFIINNDPDTNKDEYIYLAAIPASNYIKDGMRYLAPIVYQGDTTETNYFGTDADRGTVDTTTQYLIDDWNDYLAMFGKTAAEYTLPSDPIKAAAEIAVDNWETSKLAVIAVDGSSFTDTEETILEKTTTLKRKVEVKTLPGDNEKLPGPVGYPMFLGEEWGAIALAAYGVTKSYGDDACTYIENIFPDYMSYSSDWWPTPWDGAGDAIDVYYPITQKGLWTVGTQLKAGQFDSYKITKIAGDRYNIDVSSADCVITATVRTDEPSDLLVFLVDPDGNLKAPDIPRWNGPVLPIHEWYGFENPPVNPWRRWDPEDHTEFTAQVLHPQPGKWTVIVVPRYETGASTIPYTVTAKIKTVNPRRADAIISAANAAIIASQEHAPLLYVTEDSVPSETQNALSKLGVTEVIFIERGNIGENVKSSLPSIKDDLTTMQDIIDYIKAYPNTENYITITSIKTGDGYFAPAAMLAAYHCSPLLRIGEAPGLPAAVADRIETWRLWDGDYYHGSRSTGHLPKAMEPVPGEWTAQSLASAIIYMLSGGESGSIPPVGMDADRYWKCELYDDIHDWIAGYGLDGDGQEAYCFVAPRDDIYIPAHSVMIGNNSYAGHIPGITPAYTSAIVVRDILYPALIFVNPGRDITTSQLMNFPDGGTWTTNDGKTYSVYSSREIKKSFGSHGRVYDGHCLWRAHLKRMNDGASIMYYSGHGTGGSGISAQYEQTEHCKYPEQVWWDCWRGYSYDNWKMPRHNGRVWYNPKPPNLYDIIHFDHVDELFGNLHSNAIFYMSCTTADGDGPMVYLDHGALMFYGNAGSGLCPEADLQDDEFFKDILVNGETIGQAYSKQVWLHYRDYTTQDPTAMYGPSTLYGGLSITITTMQCIYGDPNLIIYSPEWTAPVPADS